MRYRPPLLLFITPVLLAALAQTSGCVRQAKISPAPPGGVYLSTSAGANFDQSVNLAGQEGKYIATFPLREAFRVPQTPQVIYIAAAERGLVVTDNGGESWKVLTTPLTSTLDVVVLANGALVISGTGPEGQGFILRSLDKGQSWQTVLTIPVPKEKGSFEIIHTQTEVPSVVLSLEPDPFQADRLYAGSNLGSIFVGEQSAKVWKTIQTLSSNRYDPLNSRASLAIDRLIPSPYQAGELLVITTTHSLLRVRDGTQKEIIIPQYIGEPRPYVVTNNSRKVYDVKFVPGYPQALFVGVEDGAVLSRDGGVTWQELHLPVESSQHFNSVAVAVSPTNSSRLLVAINNVMYRSEDGGQTWNTFVLNITNYFVRTILIDPTNAARVLVITAPVNT